MAITDDDDDDDNNDRHFVNSINDEFHRTNIKSKTVINWTQTKIGHITAVTSASVFALFFVLVVAAAAFNYCRRRRRGQGSFELDRTVSAAAARRGYHPCHFDDVTSRCRDNDVEDDDDVIVKSANGFAVDSGTARKQFTDSSRRHQGNKKNKSKHKHIFTKEWYV